MAITVYLVSGRFSLGSGPVWYCLGPSSTAIEGLQANRALLELPDKGEAGSSLAAWERSGSPSEPITKPLLGNLIKMADGHDVEIS